MFTIIFQSLLSWWIGRGMSTPILVNASSYYWVISKNVADMIQRLCNLNYFTILYNCNLSDIFLQSVF